MYYSNLIAPAGLWPLSSPLAGQKRPPILPLRVLLFCLAFDYVGPASRFAPVIRPVQRATYVKLMHHSVVVQFEIRASLIVTSVLNTLCNNFVRSNFIAGIKEAACICDSSGRVAGCFICELNSCYRCMYPSSRATGH
jgi:hypothetical protein